MEEPSQSELHSINGRAENFRKVCKQLSKFPNRSPQYYTSMEKPVKKALEDIGLIENIHFFHNARISTKNKNGRKVHYWIDFMIPSMNMAIECSPAMFHKLKRKIESDNNKKDYLTKQGLIFVELNGDDIESLQDTNIKLLLREVLDRNG